MSQLPLHLTGILRTTKPILWQRESCLSFSFFLKHNKGKAGTSDSFAFLWFLLSFLVSFAVLTGVGGVAVRF